MANKTSDNSDNDSELNNWKSTIAIIRETRRKQENRILVEAIFLFVCWVAILLIGIDILTQERRF